MIRQTISLESITIANKNKVRIKALIGICIFFSIYFIQYFADSVLNNLTLMYTTSMAVKVSSLQ